MAADWISFWSFSNIWRDWMIDSIERICFDFVVCAFLGDDGCRGSYGVGVGVGIDVGIDNWIIVV